MFKKFTILLACSIFLLVVLAFIKLRIVPTFGKDPNNLNGAITIAVDGRGILQVVAFLDGKKCPGEFYEESRDLLKYWMQTQFFSNGPHKMVIVSKVPGFNIPISQSSVNVVFNNEVSSITIDKGYAPGEDLHFSALSSSSLASYTVEVNDFFDENARVYEKSFTGDINAVIPAEAFSTDNQNYKLLVKDSSGNVKFEEVIARDYDKWVKWEKSQKQ
ncbi:MAG: hypothetical protein WC454_02330 [Phycisphaerae bacterium]|jgi:hypothetical protein